MANTEELTPHEILELHEFIRDQNLGIKKLQTSTGIVKDQEFAALIQGIIGARRQRLVEMQQLISSAGVLQ